MEQPIGAGLTFEKVWAAIQATNESLDRQIQAINESLDKQIQATRELLDKQIQDADKRMKAADKRMKVVDKQIGELGNRFGDMVEYMVLPNLVTKFEKLGYTFTKANRTRIRDKENDIYMEVDVLMENGHKVLAVEIKAKPSISDIDEHIERLKKLRLYADLHNDTRGYLGGIAGVVFGDSQKAYALKKGLFVIEPSGETFKITAPSGDGHPYEW